MNDTATGPVARKITERLTQSLAPTRLAVINDSAQHRGHMGDDGSGESHFTVDIVSPLFEGKNRVARQRLVNQALAHLLAHDIHALAIRTRTPDEDGV